MLRIDKDYDGVIRYSEFVDVLESKGGYKDRLDERAKKKLA